MNVKQNLLPPSPPLDFMQCEDNCSEDFTNFSLDSVQKDNYNTTINNHCNCNEENKIKIFNTNIQRRKRYIPKFTIGYRSDCKKCRDGVPNHYGHINYE
ncbi:hypothetical protein PIROE2DRAFT_8250 [Piromyces sp. E2]|nr:hypothetical protein PIROE2DRAFT_8250 [Piromyces sp. E2]|eukprot:OUM64861.1 hypothetical protein PIROE2DRAFT_8250 [Piromyces sp. E2]